MNIRCEGNTDIFINDFKRQWHTHVTANGAKFPVWCDGLCFLNRRVLKSKVHVKLWMEETSLDSHTLIDG